MSITIARSIAGSTVLSHVAMRHIQQEMPSKQRERLIHFICQKEVIPDMMLLLPRTIGDIMWEGESEDMQVVSVEYDRNNDIFLRLMMLLAHHSLFVSTFTELVRAPQFLFSQFHLDFSRGFQLIRGVVTPESFFTKEEKWGILTPEFETEIKSTFVPEVWENLDYFCFLCFWLVEYRDIFCPAEAYADYRRQIDIEIAGNQAERKTGVSRTQLRKLSKTLGKLRQERETVEKDEKAQESRVSSLGGKLAEIMAGMFPREEGVDWFVDTCVFPRLLASSADALFCAELAGKLVAWKVKGFRIGRFVNRILAGILGILRTATTSEVLNCGFFLAEVLENLRHGRVKKEVYLKECWKSEAFLEWEGDGDASYDGFCKVCLTNGVDCRHMMSGWNASATSLSGICSRWN